VHGPDENGFDLMRFDWAEQTSLEQLQVCLSRIHSAIGNPEISALWFETFGFRTFLDVRPKGHFREGHSSIHVDWTSDADFPAKNAVSWLTWQLHTSPFSIGLGIDELNVVQDVSTTFNWN